MLVLAAAQNAVLEEVVMVGYLYTRWLRAGWSLPAVVVTSALIRGSYHLYQGFGGFVGNVVMGLFFGWVYTRTRRVGPPRRGPHPARRGRLRGLRPAQGPPGLAQLGTPEAGRRAASAAS